MAQTDKTFKTYPGSEMTLISVTQMGAQMEKVIFDNLPASKKFSDVEIVLVHFVATLICGTLKKPEYIRARIEAFCNSIRAYADSWIKANTKEK